MVCTPTVHPGLWCPVLCLSGTHLDRDTGVVLESRTLPPPLPVSVKGVPTDEESGWGPAAVSTMYLGVLTCVSWDWALSQRPPGPPRCQVGASVTRFETCVVPLECDVASEVSCELCTCGRLVRARPSTPRESLEYSLRRVSHFPSRRRDNSGVDPWPNLQVFEESMATRRVWGSFDYCKSDDSGLYTSVCTFPVDQNPQRQVSSHRHPGPPLPLRHPRPVRVPPTPTTLQTPETRGGGHLLGSRGVTLLVGPDGTRHPHPCSWTGTLYQCRHGPSSGRTYSRGRQSCSPSRAAPPARETYH